MCTHFISAQCESPSCVLLSFSVVLVSSLAEQRCRAANIQALSMRLTQLAGLILSMMQLSFHI